MPEASSPAPLPRSEDRVVIGHDPGTTFGITILKGPVLIRCFDAELKCTGPSRLLELADWIHNIVTTYRPALYVMEGYAFGTRSQKGIFSTGELKGIVKAVLAIHDVPFLEVPPSQTLKWITGSGKGGDKSQTPLHVFKRWGVECKSSHAAEGYGLARLGLNILAPGIDDLIAAQKEVLEKHGQESIVQDPRGSGVPPRRRGKQQGTLHRAVRHFLTCPGAQAGAGSDDGEHSG